MELSLEEAATRLGKTVRQVRYMIRKNAVPARKVAGRWMIDSEAVPRSEGQARAAARKHEALRDAVDAALGPQIGTQAPLRYSVHQLKAFQMALPIHRQASERLGPEHPATVAVATTLRHLACGCHRYDREAKLDAYRAARDSASVAVCEAALASNVDAGPVDALTRAIEQEVLPAISGLLRRIERPRGERAGGP